MMNLSHNEPDKPFHDLTFQLGGFNQKQWLIVFYR